MSREPKSKRSRNFLHIIDDMIKHIDEYTVPQYGDAPNDSIEYWLAIDCVKNIEKYVKRFGKNQRKGQAKLDMLKIIHYAQLAYDKIEEE